MLDVRLKYSRTFKHARQLNYSSRYMHRLGNPAPNLSLLKAGYTNPLGLKVQKKREDFFLVQKCFFLRLKFYAMNLFKLFKFKSKRQVSFEQPIPEYCSRTHVLGATGVYSPFARDLESFHFTILPFSQIGRSYKYSIRVTVNNLFWHIFF